MNNKKKLPRGSINVKKIISAFIAMLYYGFAFWLTVLNRKTDPNRKNYEGDVFWSLKIAIKAPISSASKEIVVNLLMFFPIGVLLSMSLENIAPKRIQISIIMLIAILMSFIIEISQLKLMRGAFEYADILYNTVGALFGFIVFSIVNKAIIKRKQTK